MGGSKNYNPDGGFSEQEYESKEQTANGIKIITKKGHSHSNTPSYSNTPNTKYAKTNSRNGLVDQVAVYGRDNEQRGKIKDIDTDHKHTNPDKKTRFNDTDIHVHIYDENGNRSNYARKPSKKERRLFMIARYGKRRKK